MSNKKTFFWVEQNVSETVYKLFSNWTRNVHRMYEMYQINECSNCSVAQFLKTWVENMQKLFS